MIHTSRFAASVLTLAALTLSATGAMAQRSSDEVVGDTAAGAAKGASAGAVGGVLFGEMRRSR